MILPFSTKFKDGTPTYFIEKIWICLLENTELFGLCEYENEFYKQFEKSWNFKNNINPKFHTIREDVHDRWHAGRMIHPVINNRSKDQFQFAPAFPCVSTQKIEIKKHDHMLEVFIDDELIGHYFQKPNCCDSHAIEQLALNDGFDSFGSFFKWFNHDFTGKIIHWTSLKY